MERSIFNQFLVIMALWMVPQLGSSQNRPMHEVHAMMIYNFTKYVQWPAYDASQNFVVGVLGSDDVYNTLNAWYGGKERGNKKFVIKKYDSPDQLEECHIIYVAKDSSNDFEAVKEKIGKSSTLIITDRRGLGKAGSGINFTTDKGKLSIELNQSVLKLANLRVSSQLVTIAKII